MKACFYKIYNSNKYTMIFFYELYYKVEFSDLY